VANNEEELMRQMIREVRGVRDDLLAAIREASEQLDATVKAAQALLERRRGDNGPADVRELRPTLRPGGDDGDG